MIKRNRQYIERKQVAKIEIEWGWKFVLRTIIGHLKRFSRKKVSLWKFGAPDKAFSLVKKS